MDAPDSNLTVIGLMSGTSADGIDAAAVGVRGSGSPAEIEFLCYRHSPYTPDVRASLLEIASSGNQNGPARIASMSFTLGELFAEAALECASSAGLQLHDVNCIGCHGHTVYHQGSRSPDGRSACTLQIGEAAVIAERTGITVVSDFRVSDIAAGGQGAPLVPYFDWVFLRNKDTSRAAQNIGGIANVTCLPAGCGLDDVIAFDTGPGNMLIDAAAALFSHGKLSFDADGRMAAAGRVNPALLEKLLSDPYYRTAPPKSAGREQFGAHYLQNVLQWRESQGLSPNDIVATLTALTAESIVQAYEKFLPKPVEEMIVSGGGADNPVLMAMLEKSFRGRVRRFDEFGIPGRAKEAAAFALLAAETLRGVPANVPSATGAARRVVLGKITPGRANGEVQGGLL